MSDPMVVLESIRDALDAVDGVKTCKIGMEAGITPADYPLVRIVPTIITDAIARSPVGYIDALIYFGMPVHEFTEGLEAVYASMFAFRTKLLAAARAANTAAEVVLLETILDEDKIEAYKLMALKVRIAG